MAAQVTNYQCPACTGPLHFSSASGNLECDYCGSVFSPQEIQALYAKAEEAAAQAAEAEEFAPEATPAPGSTIPLDQQTETDWEPAAETDWDLSGLEGDWGAEGQNLRVYNCPSCGAELICEVTTAATSCPYCGNPSILPGQLSGTLKPDLIIPFQLDREAAEQALKRHCRRRPLLPGRFSEKNHLREAKGIYVPFWLFSGDADADVTFHATRTRTYTKGNYRITETSHFHVRRAGNVQFRQIPADASKKMPDDLMDSIEPYDYSQFLPFSTAYLPGYLADKYDVTAKQSIKRADRRSRSTALDVMRADVSGYETVNVSARQISLHRGQVQYALLPVWLLKTQWKDQDFLFAMNGQTGKIVGDLPVDRRRYWGLFAAITILAAALFTVTGAARVAGMILLELLSWVFE